MDDRTQLSAAYEHTLRCLHALGADMTENEFNLTSRCPGWTVKDLFSHVVGVERWILGLADPPRYVPAQGPHVRGPLGRRLEVAVDLRRARKGLTIIGELGTIMFRRIEGLHRDDRDLDLDVPNPLGGNIRLKSLLRLRVFDLWAHEQDIREATNKPGGWLSPGADISLGLLQRSLPVVLARTKDLAEGSVVTFVTTGPGRFTKAFVVGRDGAGATVAEPLLDHVPVQNAQRTRPARSGVVDGPRCRIEMSTRDFVARSCGREASAQTPVGVSGDETMAARILDEMAVTP